MDRHLKNCRSLERVTLPKNLTYLGGEAFYRCSSLEEVNLPAGLTEIRGNTFEECSSLLRIEIPDNVTRIGGHAFYGNTSLEEVVISPDSKLQQIGSSAFRCCDSLREITLPRGVSVNERAFKETPVRIDYYVLSGQHLTSQEVLEQLHSKGIALDEPIVKMYLSFGEADGTVCSGIEKNGKHTYALTCERIPGCHRALP